MREVERLVARFLTNAEGERFFLWLVKGRGVSVRYARDIVSALRRPFNGSRYSVVSRRLFLAYLEYRYGVDVSPHLRRLRVPQPGVDLEVPSEDAVREAVERSRASRDLHVMYVFLLATGVRVTEAVRILPRVPEPGPGVDVVSVEYTWRRGKKRVYVAFMPASVAGYIAGQELRVHRPEYYSRQAGRLGIVRPKYIRKFVAQRMIDLGVPPDIVDFIQGRTPQRNLVLLTHYASLKNRAREEYRKYAVWLEKFLEGTGVPT